MATEVVMLRFTHEMEEGTIARWLKSEGDAVRQGEPLLEVITDKVNVEVEAPATGTLRRILVPVDQPVAVGATVAWIGTPDEPLPGTPEPVTRHLQPRPSEVSQPAAVGRPVPEIAPDDARSGGRIVASPIAQRIAREKGVDLSLVTGSGPRGRITEADVLRFAETTADTAPAGAPGPAVPPRAAPAPASVVTPGLPGEFVSLSRLRKATGERMTRSFQTAPHFALNVEVDMAEATRWREQNAGRKPSVTAMLVKVVAEALRRFPQVNASFTAQGVLQYTAVNVGVAVAVEEGLIVPVIRDADRKTVAEIGGELSRFEHKARSLRFEATELSGSTFTITNLGMFGIDSFRAIINPPEAAILAVGRIADRPVGVGGQVVLRPTMHLTLSVDHRVLDGAAAAPFLIEIKSLLENPHPLI